MALGVDQDVLGLQVPVGDALCLVQELEDEDDFGGIELRGGLIESSRSPQVAEDLATGTVVKLRTCISNWSSQRRRRRGAYQHEERIMTLEARDHGGYEGVSGHGREHIALVPHMFDLLELDD
jgi:hypothetical protein